MIDASVKAQGAAASKGKERRQLKDGNRISIRKTRRGALQLLLVDHNLGRAINLFSAMHLSSARKSRNNLGTAHKFATAAFLTGPPVTSSVMMEMDHVAFRTRSYTWHARFSEKLLANLSRQLAILNNFLSSYQRSQIHLPFH